LDSSHVLGDLDLNLNLNLTISESMDLDLNLDSDLEKGDLDLGLDLPLWDLSHLTSLLSVGHIAALIFYRGYYKSR